jgi:hypothetical protein
MEIAQRKLLKSDILCYRRNLKIVLLIFLCKEKYKCLSIIFLFVCVCLLMRNTTKSNKYVAIYKNCINSECIKHIFLLKIVSKDVN